MTGSLGHQVYRSSEQEEEEVVEKVQVIETREVQAEAPRAVEPETDAALRLELALEPMHADDEHADQSETSHARCTTAYSD